MRNIEAVILDWAGTAVDYGCFAPVEAFLEVFRQFGIEPTVDEVRKPMGLLKRDHIKTMLQMERIRSLWMEQYQQEPSEDDIDQMYRLFETKLFQILHRFTNPKPHVIETVKILRDKGIKIGSTTGYTDAMMQIVTKGAKEAGYEPDAWFSPDSTGNLGRPYPYMIFKNMEQLQISSVQNVWKIGDTISDITEGKHAGVVSVGILEGSSEMGLTEVEYNQLSTKEQEHLLKETEKRFRCAGADYVIKHMGELPKLIEQANAEQGMQF